MPFLSLREQGWEWTADYQRYMPVTMDKRVFALYRYSHCLCLLDSIYSSDGIILALWTAQYLEIIKVKRVEIHHLVFCTFLAVILISETQIFQIEDKIFLQKSYIPKLLSMHISYAFQRYRYPAVFP